MQAEIESRPLLFNDFMTMTADEVPIYNQVSGYEALRKTLDAKLAEHNESNTVMDLVLFQQVIREALADLVAIRDRIVKRDLLSQHKP